MTRGVVGILLLGVSLAVAAEPEGYVGISVGSDISTVIAVHPDSPAARAGVLVGDHILTIDGHSTRGISPAELGRLVVGAVGSAIQLDVQRTGIHDVVRLRLYRLPQPTPAPSIPPDFNPHQASNAPKDLTQQCS